MHGPVWNNDKVGVTGEPKFRSQEPDYVTVIDPHGRTVTLTGTAAAEHRESEKV